MIRSLRQHMYLRPCECIGKITCRRSDAYIRSTIKLSVPTRGVSYRRAIFVPRTLLYLSASWPDRYKAGVADDADFRQLANLSLQHPGLTYLTRILHFDDLCSTLHVYIDLQGLCENMLVCVRPFTRLKSSVTIPLPCILTSSTLTP